MSSPKKKPNNWDRTLVGKYIRQIENPDSIGWNPNKKIWEAPSKPGYDKRNRGMGVDILNNAAAKVLTEGRPGRYLTEQEESDLRNQHIDYSLGVIGRQKGYIDGIDYMSPRKEAEAVGLIYRGDAGQLKNPNTALGKAYRSLDEEDFHKAVSDYYHSKGLHERAKQNDLFWQQQQPVVPVNVPQETQPYFSGLKERVNGAFQNGVRTGSKTGSWAYGGKMGNMLGKGGLADSQKNWRQKHQSQWYGFLKKKGLNDADASRLSGFFTVQDGLESAGGTSAAAREKNNYGGMQRSGMECSGLELKRVEDKWRMMSSKFKHALGAKSIDEFATTLGNPELAGKNYLYYVTDKVKYDPKSNAWRNAQTKHMHNYINGMRTWAGMNTIKFNDEAIGYNGQERRDKIYGQYGDYHETPAFMPSNPEAFFAPLSTYTRPVVAEEPEQPLVDMAALEAQQQREAERQERRERLGLLLGMIGGGNENSSLSGLIGLLGGKGFNGLNGLMGY